MKKRLITLFTAVLFSITTVPSLAQNVSYGIVKFGECVTESKYGKDEQKSFEDIKNQMTTLMTDIEKQRNDIVKQLNDPDFVDSLNPDAESELQARYQTLNEELGQYQNQYMQVMQQANMKLMQVMNNHVEKASKKVAKQKNINMILREEAFFHYENTSDFTKDIIKEMDKNYAKDNKQAAQTEQIKTPKQEQVK